MKNLHAGWEEKSEINKSENAYLLNT